MSLSSIRTRREYRKLNDATRLIIYEQCHSLFSVLKLDSNEHESSNSRLTASSQALEHLVGWDKNAESSKAKSELFRSPGFFPARWTVPGFPRMVWLPTVMHGFHWLAAPTCSNFRMIVDESFTAFTRSLSDSSRVNSNGTLILVWPCMRVEQNSHSNDDSDLLQLSISYARLTLAKCWTGGGGRDSVPYISDGDARRNFQKKLLGPTSYHIGCGSSEFYSLKVTSEIFIHE